MTNRVVSLTSDLAEANRLRAPVGDDVREEIEGLVVHACTVPCEKANILPIVDRIISRLRAQDATVLQGTRSALKLEIARAKAAESRVSELTRQLEEAKRQK